jgi:hypothetical protein
MASIDVRREHPELTRSSENIARLETKIDQRAIQLRDVSKDAVSYDKDGAATIKRVLALFAWEDSGNAEEEAE